MPLLTDEFNSNDYKTQKINGFVLGVAYGNGSGGTTFMTYDFMARILVTRTGSSDGGTSVTPFAQLDHDALISLRDQLVKLGGHPPELAPEAPAGTTPQKKFNL